MDRIGYACLQTLTNSESYQMSMYSSGAGDLFNQVFRFGLDDHLLELETTDSSTSSDSNNSENQNQSQSQSQTETQTQNKRKKIKTKHTGHRYHIKQQNQIQNQQTQTVVEKTATITEYLPIFPTSVNSNITIELPQIRAGQDIYNDVPILFQLGGSGGAHSVGGNDIAGGGASANGLGIGNGWTAGGSSSSTSSTT
ncbi:unnamed protein product [Ambrosiozyma monospora]|uniref:Unnamed protein product n=1 Tax=Ambrosiozyma monospora TaxID=43982 RepID=A0A9W6WJP2_AMBMO|nr:unnamed protein product [Ambrosiozyma monospora]